MRRLSPGARSRRAPQARQAVESPVCGHFSTRASAAPPCGGGGGRGTILLPLSPAATRLASVVSISRNPAATPLGPAGASGVGRTASAAWPLCTLAGTDQPGGRTVPLAAIIASLHHADAHQKCREMCAPRRSNAFESASPRQLGQEEGGGMTLQRDPRAGGGRPDSPPPTLDRIWRIRAFSPPTPEPPRRARDGGRATAATRSAPVATRAARVAADATHARGQ